jgi:uncharacterized membrane protein YfcA
VGRAGTFNCFGGKQGSKFSGDSVFNVEFFRKGHFEIKPLLVSFLMAVLGSVVGATILKHLIS